MATNYMERLKIPIEGDSRTVFSTKQNMVIAHGYERIVIGGRGPYIEFKESQIEGHQIYIPVAEEYRVSSDSVYYVEYRTIDQEPGHVKIYFQKKTVDYADYKVGMYYISPFDLLANGNVIIEKLRRKKDD